MPSDESRRGCGIVAIRCKQKKLWCCHHPMKEEEVVVFVAFREVVVLSPSEIKQEVDTMAKQVGSNN